MNVLDWFIKYRRMFFATLGGGLIMLGLLVGYGNNAGSDLISFGLGFLVTVLLLEWLMPSSSK